MISIYAKIHYFVSDVVPGTSEKEQMQKEILAFCRKMIQDENKLPEIPLSEILEKVAKIKGVKAEDLKSKRKDRDLAYTRCSFVEIAKMTYPLMALRVIGEEINKDHSTVFAMQKEIGNVKEKREFFEKILKEYRK